MPNEYLQFRCCMCPNKQRGLLICPAIPGILHPEESPCRFVKIYQDDRGWKYFVRTGIGENNYKTFYQKPGKKSPHGYTRLTWRETFDEAQSDLNLLAESKGWHSI